MAHSLSPVITCLFLYPRMTSRSLTNILFFPPALLPIAALQFISWSYPPTNSSLVPGSWLMITFLSLLHSFLLSFPMPEIEVEQKGKWVVWSPPSPLRLLVLWCWVQLPSRLLPSLIASPVKCLTHRRIVCTRGVQMNCKTEFQMTWTVIECSFFSRNVKENTSCSVSIFPGTLA